MSLSYNNATLHDWPALYHPRIELHNFQHEPARQPRGRYLYGANLIFRYTLYWTLCFYTPLFLFCGVYAFLNITFPPRRPLPTMQVSNRSQEDRLLASPHTETHPMLSVPSLRPSSTARPARSKPRMNEHRSRVTFALLVLIFYLSCALAGAVLSALIGGYILAGVYDAANYNMSTWIPMIYALIQSLIGLLGLWPSVIDVI